MGHSCENKSVMTIILRDVILKYSCFQQPVCLEPRRGINYIATFNSLYVLRINGLGRENMAYI